MRARGRTLVLVQVEAHVAHFRAAACGSHHSAGVEAVVRPNLEDATDRASPDLVIDLLVPRGIRWQTGEPLRGVDQPDLAARRRSLIGPVVVASVRELVSPPDGPCEQGTTTDKGSGIKLLGSEALLRRIPYNS